MKTLKMTHRESDGGAMRIAAPGAVLGYVSGAITIEITDIPDNAVDHDVLRLANTTALMAAGPCLVQPPRYSYRYSELGEGKIIRA